MSFVVDQLKNALRPFAGIRIEAYDNETLTKLLNQIRKSTNAESNADIGSRVLKALKLARDIGKERKIKYEDAFFANPLLIIEELIKYKADEATVLAAIIYPMLRFEKKSDCYSSLGPADGEKLRQAYYDRICKKLGTDGERVANIVFKTLLIREVDLLERHSSAELTRVSSRKFSSYEEEHLKNLSQMVMEVASEKYDEDAEAALFIRIVQWSVYMQQFPDAFTKLLPAEDAQREQMHKFTSHIYVPLAFAYHFSELARTMEGIQLQKSDPEAYQETARIIAEARDIAARASETDYIADERGRTIAVFQAIQKKIAESLATIENQGYGTYEIQYRIKSPQSIHKKLAAARQEGKSQPDLSDIIALRIIVDTPDADAERSAVVQHYKAVKRQKQFQPVEGRHKDFFVERSRTRGYRALHDTLEFTGCNQQEGTRGAVFEVQFVGRRMHEANQYGIGSHAAYKGYEDVSMELARQKVSVYVAGNEVVKLNSGATVADLAASLGSDFALSVESASIRRNALTLPLQPGESILKQPLMTGDHVAFNYNVALVHNSQHRKEIMEACVIPSLRAKLRRQDRYYSNVEAEGRHNRPMPMRSTRLGPLVPVPIVA